MVSSSAMALSSLMSVFSTLENPNLSAWEKIPAVLMGITFSLTGVVNAFKSAHNVSTFFNQSLMKAAGTVANYGGVVSAANTSMQNFFKLSRSNTVALNDDEKATMKAAMAALFKGKIDQDNVEIMLTRMLTSRGIAEAEAAEMA
jgi:hypothetical protein